MNSIGEPAQGWVPLEVLLGHFLRHKWLFVATVVLFMGLATVYTFVAPKVYRATTEIMVVEQSTPAGGLLSEIGSFGGLAALAGLNTGGGSRRQEGLATLRSKEFLFEFIQDLDLLPTLFSDDWDAQSGAWSVDDPEDIPTSWDGYRALRESIIEVAEDPLSGLVRVSVQWLDPELSANWANLLVRRLNDRLRQRSIEDARRNLNYLEDELEKTTVVGLQQSLYGLVETEIQNIMLATVSEEYVFRVIDPAIAPEADQHVHPRLSIMLLVGMAVGTILGGFLVGLAELHRRSTT